MKKTLRNLAVAASLILGATATQAADLVQKNAYAYDIRVDGSKQHAPVVSYKLNGLASAVTVKAYANGELVASKTGTVNQSNNVTLDIPDAAYGDITFTVDVTTKTTVSTPTLIKEGKNIALTNVAYGYRFNVPMGLAVNNATESNTFGQVVVSEYSAPSGAVYHSSTAGGGRGNALYVFDPQLQPIANKQANNAYGFSGGLSMTKGEFNRVRFSQDGRLFMYSYNAAEGCGVYEFNTKSQNASDADTYNQQAVQVLTVTKPVSENVNGAITSFDAIGSGENLKLAVLEVKIGNTDATNYPSQNITPKIYNLGTKTKWTGNPSITIPASTSYLRTILRLQYVNSAWDRDGKGFSVIGFAASPTNTNEGLVHLDMTQSTPTVNYESGGTNASLFQNAYAVALNNNGSLLAMGGGSSAGHIHVYKVTYNNGVPSYSALYDITANGTTMTDVAFDYADNLYVANRSGEYLAVWQLPHQSGGVVTVPAPSSQGYYIEKVELPKLYVVGAFQDWDPENPIELEQDLQGEYVYTFPYIDGKGADKGFKLSFAKGDWPAFNAAAIGYSNDGCTILGGHSQQLYANDANNNSGNLFAPCAGTWSIKVNEDNLLTLNGRPDILKDVVYVSGDITEWNDDDIYTLSLNAADKANPVMTDKGEYEFIGTFNDFYGDFYITAGNTHFGAKGGDASITNKETMESTANGGDFVLDNKIYANVTVKFYYNPIESKSSWMNFSGTQRNHYAYNLVKIDPEQTNGGYVFKFHSTGDVDYAYIHFIDPNYTPEEISTLGSPVDKTDPGIQTWKVDNVQKGENAEIISSMWFARNCKYNWAVELPKDVTTDIVTEPVNVGGGRAAVACFTDPEYPDVYGYTVVGRSNNGGIDIYDPSGKQIASALFANNAVMGGVNPGMAAANATPNDATTQGNRVLFACQGATANGVVAVDIDKIIKGEETAPYAVYTAHDIRTVGVLGSGDETNLVVFNKNLGAYGQLEYTKIGTDNDVKNNFTTITAVTSSQLQNARVFVAATDKGFFFSQQRDDAMGSSGLNGLGFVSFPDYKYTWNISTYKTNYPTMLPSSSGGVAVNPHQNKLAVTTYTGIYMFDLSWNEDGTPNIGTAPTEIIPYPYGGGDNVTTACDIKFDAAGNLHAVSQTYGYFRVLTNEDQVEAPSTFTVDDTVTGVEDVVAGAEEAEAVFYNLNGVRVDSDSLTPGVYVKVVGKTASKVVVK